MSRPSEVIISELTRIRTALEVLEKQDSASKQAFNALYEEMEDYKQDAFFNVERSILLDLLVFYDGLKWSVSSTEDADSNKQIMDDFMDLLARRDVVPIPKLDRFDAKFHRILQVVSTDDSELDGTIAQVLKRGFYRGDKVLRIEDVSLYQIKKSD
jgi:molecular chaperone GrpE (heat shock protein)